MLTKEYRICLPMSVAEYRLAQLFMIQKKSRTESAGAGSGVEIIKNEPYENGPGNTNGQYTYKYYHIGSHLPNWLRAILPKTALIVEEEAWNAYPYTRTIYRCKFIDKFSIDIETRYYDDAGERENVFGVSDKELRDRTVDFIDIVEDELDAGDYHEEEDPRAFRSAKTGRGPLAPGWRKTYKAEQDRTKVAPKADSLWNYEFGSYPNRIMCAYKLCRVEFRYWGMQTRIERFIHDIGLRKTMVRAHRQAWCWQDEYFGLTLDDIRRLEMEAQQELAKKMEAARLLEQPDGDGPKANANANANAITTKSNESDAHATSAAASASSAAANNNNSALNHAKTPDSNETGTSTKPDGPQPARQLALPLSNAPPVKSASNGSFATALASPLDGLVEDESESEGSDDDANFENRSTLFARTQSVDDEFYDAQDYVEQSPYALSRTRSSRKSKVNRSSLSNVSHVFLIVYADIESLCNAAPSEKTASYPGFPNSMAECADSFAAKMRQMLVQAGVEQGAVAIESVDCTSVLRTFVSTLSAITVQQRSLSVDLDNASDTPQCMNDVCNIVLQAAVGSLLCANTSSTVYQNRVLSVANLINNKLAQYADSASASQKPRVFMVADSFASPIVYDVLLFDQQLAAKQSGSSRLLLTHVHDLFVCNSPLAQVLAARKFDRATNSNSSFFVENTKLYNVMYAIHPFAYRLESALLGNEFRFVSPVQVARCSVRENPLNSAMQAESRSEIGATVMRQKRLFAKYLKAEQASENSILQDLDRQLQKKFDWAWNLQRMDYVLYYPTALNELGSSTIFQFLQSSIWDSRDLVAFVLRNCISPALIRSGTDPIGTQLAASTHLAVPVSGSPSNSSSSSPRPSGSDSDELAGSKPEKWLHRRTSVKTRSAAPNHRANDALMAVNAREQTLSAKFVYGSLDVAALSGEKVDVYLVRYAASRANLQNTPARVQRGSSGRNAKKNSAAENVLATTTNLHKVRSAVDLRDEQQSKQTRRGADQRKQTSRAAPDEAAYERWCDTDKEELLLLGTEITDGNGRLAFNVPADMRSKLGIGLHTIRMVVRGDCSAVQFRTAVVQDGTECVVFSIDGSLTASLSVTGGNPKVRPAAIDIVRFWQQLGYLVLYITARPDIQTRRVSSWLFRHNFPPGLIMFMDHLSIDALRHKAEYLRRLASDTRIVFHCAYGSKKDIAVYRSVGVMPNRVFAVGCTKHVGNPKLASHANILPAGYVEHLDELRETLNAKANRTTVQDSNLNELVKSAKVQWNRLVGF